MGSAHAFASTVIAFEKRDVGLREERKAEGGREKRALEENRRDRPRKGIILLPLHTHRRQSRCVCVFGDNKRQVAGEAENETSCVVCAPTHRNTSAGGGSGVAAAPLCGSQRVVRNQRGSAGVVPGHSRQNKEYSQGMFKSNDFNSTNIPAPVRLNIATEFCQVMASHNKTKCFFFKENVL